MSADIHNPPDPREHLRWLADNVSVLFGRDGSLDEAVAFIAGFDAGHGYALLAGFQEWLVVRLGTGFEFHWMGLVRHSILDVPPGSALSGVPVPDDSAVQVFELVLEFLDDFRGRDGRRALYRRFERLRDSLGLP